jgi:hypothetical protein
VTVATSLATFLRPPRRLNPVGFGDFDGDGAMEVAYVQTPHIGGILIVMRPGPQVCVRAD